MSCIRLPHEVLSVERIEPNDESLCAAIDTGCQRTAVGQHTLEQLLQHQPEGTKVQIKDEVHLFKSVNGLSRTSKVACVPASLGPRGCILRPAVFDEGQSSKAPFLISLPFLLYCRATLVLDPVSGLKMKLGRFNCEVPLHIGPTGALRVPLGHFSADMLKSLNQAVDKLSQESAKHEAHALHTGSEEPSKSVRFRLNCASQVAEPDPRDHRDYGTHPAAEAQLQLHGTQDRVQLPGDGVAPDGSAPDGPHGERGTADDSSRDGCASSTRAAQGAADRDHPHDGGQRALHGPRHDARCKHGPALRP